MMHSQGMGGVYGANEEYLDDPEDKAGQFDTRADFDGDGPRWSEVYSPKRRADDSGR